mgnify:CR=1 FL=1
MRTGGSRGCEEALAYRATLLFKLGAREVKSTVRVAGNGDLGYVFLDCSELVSSWLDPEEVAGCIEAFLGVKVDAELVERWLEGDLEARPPPRALRNTALERALFYRTAYERALELRGERPAWSAGRIAEALSRELPIYVPESTVRGWLKGRAPSAAQLRVCPALGYRVGVLRGDYDVKRCVLKVEDREFAEYYADMCEASSGVRPEVRPARRGFWRVRDAAAGGGALRELDRSGLWKVVALMFPIEFLQGLFDSDGCVSPRVEWHNFFIYKLKDVASLLEGVSVPRVEGMVAAVEAASERRLPLVACRDEMLVFDQRLVSPIIKLAKRKWETVRMALVLLEVLGLKARVKDGSIAEVVLEGWDRAERFAKLIGFKVSYRRERLSFLMKLKAGRERDPNAYNPFTCFALWFASYMKANGRWVKRRWAAHDLAMAWLTLLSYCYGKQPLEVAPKPLPPANLVRAWGA